MIWRTLHCFVLLIFVQALPLTQQDPVGNLQEEAFKNHTDGINWDFPVIQQTLETCKHVNRSKHYFKDGEEYLDDLDLAKIETSKESRTLGRWHHMRIWLVRCLRDFNAPEQTVREIIGETGNIINVHVVGYNQLQELEETLTTLKTNEELYKYFSKSRQEFLSNMRNDSSLSISYLLCKCIKNETNEFLSEHVSQLPSTYSYVENLIIYMRYIEPMLLVLTFGIGMTLNVTLLYIFFKHDELRTLPNIMVLNLAVNDFIGLITMLPTQYAFRSYEMSNTHLIDVVMVLMFIVLSFVSVLSISILSVQRFMAVSSTNNISNHMISDKWKKSFYLIGVWMSTFICLALMLGDSVYYNMTRQGGLNLSTYMLLAILILFTVALPILVSVFNLLTSRKLAKSAKCMPGECNNEYIVRTRYVSSRIVAGLTIVFWFTHTPFFATMSFQLGFIWMERVGINPKDFDVFSLSWLYVISGYHLLYFSNTTFNSLALYLGSKKFKQLYNKYLFQRWTFGNKNIIILK